MRRLLRLLIGMVLWPGVALAQSGQVVEYYHTDALGSVRAVTKTVQGHLVIVSRHDFMPFDEEVNPASQPADKRLFTRQQRGFIYRVGNDYLVVARNGTILSYVTGADAARGIVTHIRSWAENSDREG